VRFSRNQDKFGTLQSDLSTLKDAIDFQLTKFPALYLFVERFREWVNWDKRVYLSFVRSGDTVLDVGANVGAHAVFLSHLVGMRGRVLAFEPLPANIDALNQTIRRRGRFANVSIFPLAVGNPESANRTVTMKVPGEDLTQASLQRQTMGSWEGKADVREFSVPLASLDAEKTVQSLQHLEFVKIDVEGGELDVLRGACSGELRRNPDRRLHVTDGGPRRDDRNEPRRSFRPEQAREPVSRYRPRRPGCLAGNRTSRRPGHRLVPPRSERSYSRRALARLS